MRGEELFQCRRQLFVTAASSLAPNAMKWLDFNKHMGAYITGVGGRVSRGWDITFAAKNFFNAAAHFS